MAYNSLIFYFISLNNLKKNFKKLKYTHELITQNTNLVPNYKELGYLLKQKTF